MAKVSVNCPQCSAPFDFLEECNVVRCEFCGSSLLVTGRDGVLRYVLEPKIGTTRDACSLVETNWSQEMKRKWKVVEVFMVYVPFWRIQGKCYSWFFGMRYESGGEEDPLLPKDKQWTKECITRVVDHTILAAETFPLQNRTLGVRTQAMVLKPVEEEQCKFLVPADMTKEKALETLKEMTQDIAPSRGLETELVMKKEVGIRMSLVFSPVWYVEISSAKGNEAILVDAVDGKSLRVRGMREGWIWEIFSKEEPSLQWSTLGLLPFRCPNCGWDLPYRPHDMAHLCLNCLRLWSQKRGKWMEVPYEIALGNGGIPWENGLWLPVWRIRVSLMRRGQRLETMKELKRVMGGQMANTKMGGEDPIWLYVPSTIFPNPRGHLHLATRLTSLDPSFDRGTFPGREKPKVASIELSQEEAVELAPSVLAAMVPPGNKAAIRWLVESEIIATDSRMCFLPFTPEPLSWRQIHTGLALPRGRAMDPLFPQGN